MNDIMNDGIFENGYLKKDYECNSIDEFLALLEEHKCYTEEKKILIKTLQALLQELTEKKLLPEEIHIEGYVTSLFTSSNPPAHAHQPNLSACLIYQEKEIIRAHAIIKENINLTRQNRNKYDIMGVVRSPILQNSPMSLQLQRIRKHGSKKVGAVVISAPNNTE